MDTLQNQLELALLVQILNTNANQCPNPLNLLELFHMNRFLESIRIPAVT